MPEKDRRALLRRGLEACIVGKPDVLPQLFTDDVSGWSPNMLVTSLGELVETVTYRELALSEVAVQIDALDVFVNKGLVEYRVSAVFSGPFVVDDDTVIEPNGRTLRIGAALVAEFTDGKISAFRNYFDDATLLEQMLAR